MGKLKAGLAGLIVILMMQSVCAAIGPMNYQGRLLDDVGVPVDGNVNFQVRIWDSLNSGVLKYQEDHNGVTVNDGVYSFLVGTQVKTGGDSEWDIDLWNASEIYLELVVNGEALSPRTRIAAAPYAYQANLALTTNNALALGGRTAAGYDDIVKAVCEGDSGKWLPTADICAGGAVDFSNVDKDVLEPGETDYSNLVFNNADFSNAEFSGVDFSNTVFVNVNVEGADFSNTDFTGSVWDGVYWGSTPPNLASINATNVLWSNLDMSVPFNLSTATLTGSSIAKLNGTIPAGNLPAGWQRDGSGGVTYIYGDTVNFSSTSTALISRYGTDKFLDIPYIENDLNNSTFEGVFFETAFLDGILHDVNFKYTQAHKVRFEYSELDRSTFENSIINWATFTESELTDVSFRRADLINVVFTDCGFDIDTAIDDLDFSIAKLSNVNFINFNNASLHNGEASNMDFNGAELVDVLFENSNLSNSHFNADLRNVRFVGVIINAGTSFDFLNGNVRDTTFDGIVFGAGTTSHYSRLTNVTFQNIVGNPDWRFTQVHTDVIFDAVDLSSTNFRFSTLVRVDFTDSNLTNADFTGASLTDIEWGGATCPDGFVVVDPGVENCEDGHL